MGLSVSLPVVTTVAQRNKVRNHQRDQVEKLMSKTRSQRLTRRKAPDVVEEMTKRRLRKRNHMIEVMRSQDVWTACVVPMSVEDASVLVDALAQNVAERRTDMSLVMVCQQLSKQLNKKSFSREVQ